MRGQFVSSVHLTDQLWVRRHVDNRAIIVGNDELQRNPYIQQPASLHFYDFLGFNINANSRQVTYNFRPEAWRYRLPQSAGSMRLRLSGYHSRKHLIQSIAYPAKIATQQTADLDNLYSGLGYTDHTNCA